METKNPQSWTDSQGSSITFTSWIPNVSVTVLPVQANALPVSHQHWNEPACCSLQPLRHSQRTTPPFLCVVFLATGGTNPAHSLRILLLRAGIEPNPGPPRKSDSTPPCETCGDTIRKGVSRFRCAAPGCDKACHLQPVCSYISRATAMKKKWHCTEHRSPSSPDRPSLPVQVRRTIAASSNELCPICLLKLKQNPIQCTSCLKFFHQDKACLCNQAS